MENGIDLMACSRSTQESSGPAPARVLAELGDTAVWSTETQATFQLSLTQLDASVVAFGRDRLSPLVLLHVAGFRPKMLARDRAANTTQACSG